MYSPFRQGWYVMKDGYAKIRKIHQSSNYQLRRALLYVPGDDERKISKIRTLKVDSVILDCEDGVAQNRKQNARETIQKILNTMADSQIDYGVRVNSVESGHLPEDLKVILGCNVAPQTLYLPKVNCVEDIDLFYTALQKSIEVRTAARSPLQLFIYTESCLSIMDLPTICRHAICLSQRESLPLFQLTGLVFGSDDLCASLGATRTNSSIEILYARQRSVLVAKAFGLQAIDMVDINLNELDNLRDLCEEGARMGFTGKQVIHPKQVEIVQAAFKPSPARQTWACELLKAFEEHQKSGKGAFVFRNQMIDAPTMKQAQNIVDIMRKIDD